jgi:hypothetical protein
MRHLASWRAVWKSKNSAFNCWMSHVLFEDFRSWQVQEKIFKAFFVSFIWEVRNFLRFLTIAV